MSEKTLASQILEAVGGAKNVQSVEHCATRLRFNLYDQGKASDEKVKAIKGVLGLVKSGGQYQVVVGNQVAQVHADLKALAHFGEGKGEAKKEGSVFSRFFGAIIACIAPAIPALTVGGLTKMVVILLTMSELMDSGSMTCSFLNAMGDVGLYFLPLIVAYGAAKRFNMDVGVALVSVGILLLPAFINLIGAEGGAAFLGIPVTKTSYNGQIFPAILTVFIGSHLERFFRNIIPDFLSSLLVPLCVGLISMSLAITILGPAGYMISKVLVAGIHFLEVHNMAWLATWIYATFSPLLTMTGLHLAFSPLLVATFAERGYESFVMVASLCSNIALAGAGFATVLRARNREMKSLSLSGSITALLGGVTEPLLYGVLLKYKKSLIAGLIGGCAAGAYAVFTQIKCYAMVRTSVFGVVGYVTDQSSSNFTNACITVAIALGIAFAARWFMGVEEDADDGDADMTSAAGKENAPGTAGRAGSVSSMSYAIAAPVKGKVIPLSEVKDEIFSQEMTGKGAAILPESGEVCAPFDATVVMVAESKHAIGLRSRSGVELLIHVGLDTVNLNGEYFTVLAKAGDTIVQGQKLLRFDLAALKAAGYDTVTPVVVTNTDDFLDVLPADANEVEAGDLLLSVIR